MADSTLAVGVGVVVVVASALGFVVGRQRLRYAVLVLGGLALVALSAANDPSSALRARDLALGVGPMAAMLAATAVLAPRRIAWVAATGAVLAGPVRALVYDPFLDLHCVDCRPSAVVLDPHLGLAEGLTVVGPVLGILALGLHATRTRSVGEPVLTPVAVGIALVVVLLGEDLGHPVALVAAVAAVGVQDHRGAVAERRLRGLVDALRAGRPFADVLREAWGDDDVEVSYWVPEDGAWVTPAGVARRPPPPDAMRLRWAGVVTAAVEQRGRADLVDLEPALDVPARLTLDNERLSAALAARVRQVSRSRSLVVELGDRERRRIERDLHDGVQQQLLALGLDLRGALADLPTGHPDRSVIEACLAHAQRALEDLRELSHGLYPPLLATSGLGPALLSLARRSELPLVIGTAPEGRLPASVERVVYAVVTDSVSRAGRAGVVVHVEAVDGAPSATLRVVGGPPAVAGILPDMVAALGGTVTTVGQELRVVIPCGS